MSVKLYYFNVRGLGEPIRMILTYGGIEFEDIRAPMDTIPSPLPLEIKEKCTWGQVPMIEFDGKKLCQSLAITRYYAKKVGLVPKDDFEAALCDEYVDTTRDLLTPWVPLIMEKDPEKLKELTEQTVKAVGEKFLSKFEAIVKSNGGSRLVGKGLTWADIYLAHVLNNIEIVYNVNILKDCPALKTMVDSVFSVPQIKAWISKRPITKY